MLPLAAASSPYRASVAQWRAELVAKRPKPAKLVTNLRLCQYVQDRLAGTVHDTQSREIADPQQSPFKGRDKPIRCWIFLTHGALALAPAISHPCGIGDAQSSNPVELSLIGWYFARQG